MTRSKPWKLAAAAALAATTAILGGAGLAALSGVDAPPFGTRLLGFAEAHDKRAYGLLIASSTPVARSRAVAEAKLALALSPYSNSARLRIAYVDTISRGSLGPVGLGHLARSYDLLPYDHTVAAWRVRFALEHWDVLTPDLRAAVHTEAMAFARAGSQDANVRAVLPSIRNPSGRLAAALWLRELAN